MEKPSVFIGSSSEGHAIAEAVFAHLDRETTPFLWSHQLFLPGQYPLEALEKQLKRHSFAVLVASPDDEIVKRDIASPSMRDNLLLEFGLFAGALGRRRAFFICPSSPRIELPSDLLGVITATYDATRVTGGLDDLAAAVQTPCQQIREVIREEWQATLEREAQLASQVRASEESQTIRRLYTVATRLRDALMVVQRDAFAAFSDRSAFEDIKGRAVEEVHTIADSYREDAKRVGVGQELEQLRVVTSDALLDLPFPQELSRGMEAAKQEAINVGFEALDMFLRGGDPMGHVKGVAAEEAGSRLSSLGQRYSRWWERHSPHLHRATATMQDALFEALTKSLSTQLKTI